VAVKERADAARNRRAILDAASTLFETSADPMTVTMDDVAAAAGVGKGTLFRRFGDRAGLLRAVFDTRIAALTEAIAAGPPPLGPATPARERIAAVLDAIIEVKLNNRQITRALERIEQRPDRGSFFDTPNYKRAHALFSELLAGIVGADRATWTAHVLLSLTRIDLIEHLVSAEGWTGPHVRRQIRNLAGQILGPETERPSPAHTAADSYGMYGRPDGPQ
jgi:AcrR family transcriptional regulator